MQTKIKPKQEVELKYTLKKLLEKESHTQYPVTLRVLRKKLNISQVQLWRIINMPKDSSSSASTDQLIILSEHFNISIDSLINK